MEPHWEMNCWSEEQRRRYAKQVLEHLKPLRALDRYLPPHKPLTRRQRLRRNWNEAISRIKAAWQILRHGEY